MTKKYVKDVRKGEIYLFPGLWELFCLAESGVTRPAGGGREGGEAAADVVGAREVS